MEEQPRSSAGRSGCVGDAVPALLDPRCLHGLGGYRAKGPLRAYEPAGLAGVRAIAVGRQVWARSITVYSLFLIHHKTPPTQLNLTNANLLFAAAPLFSFLRAAPRRGHRLHFTLPAPLPGARYRLRLSIP